MHTKSMSFHASSFKHFFVHNWWIHLLHVLHSTQFMSFSLPIHPQYRQKFSMSFELVKISSISFSLKLTQFNSFTYSDSASNLKTYSNANMPQLNESLCCSLCICVSQLYIITSSPLMVCRCVMKTVKSDNCFYIYSRSFDIGS